jgi:hypothetical protein
VSAKNKCRERHDFDDQVVCGTQNPRREEGERWHALCSSKGMTFHSLRLPALLLAALWLTPGGVVCAQDEPDGVTLAEIIPVLANTAAGELIVAPAPEPGQARRVRRSEVLRAMRRAGMSTEGLAIPRSTNVRRAANDLEGDALRERALPPIEASLAPCRTYDIRLPRSVSLPPGRLNIRVDARTPNRSGRTSGVVIMEARGIERRLPFSARVTCPPPAMQAGTTIRILARFGNVSASAPGEATQSGRVGDVIRVRNTTTRRALRGRILDGHNVEVVR